MKKKYITPKVELIVIDTKEVCWEGHWGGSGGWRDNYGNYRDYQGNWHHPNGDLFPEYNEENAADAHLNGNNCKPSPWVNDVMDDW